MIRDALRITKKRESDYYRGWVTREDVAGTLSLLEDG
jgi:hypothetical protein